MTLLRVPRRARQSGVVLFVALIVMVALSLAGIALIRSMDTSTSITGNIGFRQASIPPANWAIENAVNALFEAKKIADLGKDWSKENYYAYRIQTKLGKAEDTHAVPYVLQGAGTKPDNYPVDFITKADAASGNTISYVIERMCTDETSTQAEMVARCDMAPPKQSTATTAMELNKIELPPAPFYRLTVRVDGPNNTITFAQAMLR